jgi:hypothetical protein
MLMTKSQYGRTHLIRNDLQCQAVSRLPAWCRQRATLTSFIASTPTLLSTDHLCLFQVFLRQFRYKALQIRSELKPIDHLSLIPS